MEENNGNAVVQAPIEDTGTQSAPESDSGTQISQPQQANTPLESGEDVLSNDAQGNTSDDPNKQENDLNSIKGKVSHLEKEKNSLASRNRAILDSLDEYFRESGESAYEGWRKRWIAKGNTDPGSYRDIYGDSNAPTQTANNTAPQVPSGMTPEQVLQLVEQRESDKRFFEAVPELAPEKVANDPEAREKAQQAYVTVHAIASMLQSSDPTLSRHEAMIHAWKSLPQNAKREQETISEAGQLSGMAQAYARESGSTSGTEVRTTASGEKLPLNRLTQGQRERYEQLKSQRGEKFADLYAKNALGM